MAEASALERLPEKVRADVMNEAPYLREDMREIRRAEAEGWTITVPLNPGSWLIFRRGPVEIRHGDRWEAWEGEAVRRYILLAEALRIEGRALR